MKTNQREFPSFSLCGLNCGLCPRYQTKAKSKCPGCGGTDFQEKHPTCAVITCNKKHDTVEYCFKCSLYPCARYKEKSQVDSFISYQNVLVDFQKAELEGLEQYKYELEKKMAILEYLIENYNDGKRKSFYCLAINLLLLPDLQAIMDEINTNIGKQDINKQVKIKKIITLFETKAQEKNIKLVLRK